MTDKKGGEVREERQRREEEVLREIRRNLKGSYTQLRLCLEALDKLSSR